MMFLAILCALPLAGAWAQSTPKELEGIILLPGELDAIKAAQSKPITVGMTDSPPFCSLEDGKWTGLSVQLLTLIADDLDIQYTIKKYTVSELIDAIENGEVDVAAAGLNITADRAERMRFSHAFHHGGYGVAISKDIDSQMSMFRRIISYKFFIAIGSLFLILFLVGVVVWLFERRHSESDFGGGFASGLGSGLWWSAVTMSTVGYGDKAPRTIGGRFIAIIWIFASVILISGFTAAIASSLTVGSMTSTVAALHDLKNVPTGTVEGSSAEAFVRNRGIRTTSFKTLDDALLAIGTKTIDAVVNDASVLRYTISEHSIRGVVTSNFRFGSLDYAFAFPVNSPIARPISIEILKQTESSSWPGVLRRYLSLESD